jgi:RND family efflux transporter MFP subunit
MSNSIEVEKNSGRVGDSPGNPKKNRNTSVYIGGIVVLAVAILLIVLLSSLRKSSIQAETKTRNESVAAGPFVRVSRVMVSPPSESIILEGDAHPYASVTLYAKISGYLKSIKVDKGDNVKEGQLLATLESPETDRQYLAAQADAKNKANIATRNRELLQRQLIAPQSAEQSDADAEVAKENLAALDQQKGYEIIRAPFSGTVTARYADPGALVQNAANGQSSALPVVALADLNRLRIDIYLDQRYAAYVHDGDSVQVTLSERPGFAINAKVTRFTGELDPVTRMLLVEIEVPNAGHAIVPGSTVQVRLRVKKASSMQLPSTALIIRGTKYLVPVLDSGNRVEFRPVKIGENSGDNVEIIAGLKGDETVALNLGETVVEGSRVQPVATTPPPTVGQPAQQTNSTPK